MKLTVLALLGHTLLLTCVAGTCDPQSGTCTLGADQALLQARSELSRSSADDGPAYGAGWNFGGRLLFASNDGEGVFEVDVGSIDIDAKKVAIEKVGDSTATTFNDGLNCITKSAPENWVPSFLSNPPPTVSPATLTEATKTTSVTPYDCKSHNVPAQVLRQGPGEEFNLKTLDIFTGTYTTLYPIPYSRTSPPFSDINSCAISPISSIIYCTIMMPDGHFLVRVDATQMEFAAKLPPAEDNYIAAAFGPTGAFHFSEVGARKVELISIDDVDSLPGYADQNDPGLTDMSSVATSTVNKVADWVVWQGEVKGGPNTEWLLGIVKGGKKGVLVDAATRKKYTLDIDGLPADSSAYGAGWSFQGRLFFASNSGEGVYEVDVGSIDIVDKKVSVEKVGDSAETNFNDGLNCLTESAPDKWKPSFGSLTPPADATTIPPTITSVAPYDCDSHNVPAQVLREGDSGQEFNLKTLDIATGTYTTLYPIPYSLTSPPFEDINSCAISPLSSIVYCTLMMPDGGLYLVRVDASQIEFVAILPPSEKKYIAAAFGPTGTFYFSEMGKGLVELILIDQPDDLPGFADLNDYGLTDLSNSRTSLVQKVADWVVWNGPVKGGPDSEWLLGIMRGGKTAILINGPTRAMHELDIIDA